MNNGNANINKKITIFKQHLHKKTKNKKQKQKTNKNTRALGELLFFKKPFFNKKKRCFFFK